MCVRLRKIPMERLRHLFGSVFLGEVQVMGTIALEATSFGSITISGKNYDHDVYVFWDGTVERRVGDHTVPARQMEYIIRSKPEIVIIGTGQFGIVRVPSESEKLAKEQDIEVVKARTPQAIRIFNEAMKKGKRVSAIIHVTC